MVWVRHFYRPTPKERAMGLLSQNSKKEYAMRICAAPGCGRLVEVGRYCDKHKDLASDTTPVARPTNKVADGRWSESANDPLYNTARWRRLRAQVLKESAGCAVCGSTDKLEVHHLVNPQGDPNLFFDRDNLTVLCKVHHAQITRQTCRRMDNKRGFERM